MLKSLIALFFVLLMAFCNCTNYNMIKSNKIDYNTLLDLCKNDLKIKNIICDSLGIRGIDSLTGWKVWVINDNKDSHIKFSTLFAFNDSLSENSILRLCNNTNSTNNYVKFSMVPISPKLSCNALWAQADFYYNKGLDPSMLVSLYEKFRYITGYSYLQNFQGYLK